MPLLANTLLTTARAQYTASLNSGNGGTGLPQGNLVAIRAHLDTPTQQQAIFLAAEGIAAKYVAEVDSGTDIVMGDTIASITLLDGLTPFPIALPPGASIVVSWVNEEAPLLLPARLVYLSFLTTQGPATAFT